LEYKLNYESLEYLRSYGTMEYLLAARQVRKMEILDNSITPIFLLKQMSLQTLIIKGIVK
jgi:hypothetical protein